ncbi:MAG: hypothetical protein RXP86_06215 [Acidilobus sp.]
MQAAQTTPSRSAPARSLLRRQYYLSARRAKVWLSDGLLTL